MNPEFPRQIFEKKNHISNFKKIRLVGAELSHADGRTYRRTDETNSCLSCFFANAPNNDGAVHTTIKLGTGRPRNRGSIPRRGFSKASTPAKQPTYTPVQLQPKGLRSLKERPWCHADH